MSIQDVTIVDKVVNASENFDTSVNGVDRYSIQAVFDLNPTKTFETSDVNIVSDVITLENHGFQEDEIVQFSSTDTLPAGISALTNYYIVNKTTDTFQLALQSGGGGVKEVTSINAVAEGSTKEITDITALADVEAVSEVTSITAIEDGSVKEITSITCVADVDDSLDKKYFILQDDVGSVGFWYDVDNSGTQVDPVLVAATDRQVEITTITTGMTATQVGTATYNAIVADSKFEAGADGGDGSLTVQSTTYGNKDAASEGNSGFTITEDTAGSNSTLDGKYFVLQDADGSVGVWFDVDDSGTTIPAGASACDRAIEITTVSTADSAVTIGGLLRTALDSDSKFGTSGSGAECIVTNADAQALDDAADGDTGFTFNTTTQGVTAASLDGKYFILQDDVGSVAFWFDVGNSGTSVPSHGADRAVEITTIVAGDDLATVGTKVYTAIVTDSKFESGTDNLDGTFSVKSTTFGDKSSASEGDSGFTITEGTAGSDTFLDGKYFILEDSAGTVAFWFDVGDSGTTIPSGASACDRAVEITTLTQGMTATQVATAVYNAVVNDSKFEAGADGGDGTMTIQNAEYLAITQKDAGDSTFTLAQDTAYSEGIDITDVGVGTHTAQATTAIDTATITYQQSNDKVNWENIESAVSLSADGTDILEVTNNVCKYVRCAYAATAGSINLKLLLHANSNS